MANLNPIERKCFEYWNFDIPEGTFVLSSGQIVDPNKALQEKITTYGFPDGSGVEINNTQRMFRVYRNNQLNSELIL